MTYTFSRPRFRTSTALAKKPLHGSATFDLASVGSDGQDSSHTLSVAGAQVGDNVDVYPELPVDDLVYKAYVSAADTVKIVVSNPTAAPIDAPSTEYRVVVWSPEA